MNDTNRQDELTRALRRLKQDDEALTASPQVEARLLSEVRALGRRRSRLVMLTLAAAASVVLVVSISWWTRSAPVPNPPVSVAEVTTPFYPLFYASVPASGGTVVRMEVPASSLARFGLVSADGFERASGTVLADVLVGQDGLARAIRFVRKL